MRLRLQLQFGTFKISRHFSHPLVQHYNLNPHNQSLIFLLCSVFLTFLCSVLHINLPYLLFFLHYHFSIFSTSHPSFISHSYLLFSLKLSFLFPLSFYSIVKLFILSSFFSMSFVIPIYSVLPLISTVLSFLVDLLPYPLLSSLYSALPLMPTSPQLNLFFHDFQFNNT
uniref:Uncharacterized protein n=1 Tax=Cacopsylla melanoneura TaxID=428564 RepID=A0A8D9B587_9HEMI